MPKHEQFAVTDLPPAALFYHHDSHAVLFNFFPTLQQLQQYLAKRYKVCRAPKLHLPDYLVTQLFGYRAPFPQLPSSLEARLLENFLSRVECTIVHTTHELWSDLPLLSVSALVSSGAALAGRSSKYRENSKESDSFYGV